MTDTSMMTSLYERWLTDLWNGDLERLEQVAENLVTSGFVGHWPGRPGLVNGPDELAGVVRAGRLPFEQLTFSVTVGPLAHGDLLAARWVAQGSYAGGENALPGLSRHPGHRCGSTVTTSSGLRTDG